ncbi:MAG TPA: YncE family protein, partial [Xanthobacteraceae bacterium]|nr:YncE family protein [Xanthobacteraceae bacterium]
MHRHTPLVGALSLAVLISVPSGASGQLALSANDGKAVLVDGVNSVPANPPPDSITIIDLNATPPKTVAEVQAPASVVGPP